MSGFIKEEKGAASLIEYTIVFPIVFIVCCLLIFMGFIQYERAVVVSAAQRGAVVGAKLLADPHYAEIAGLDTSASKDYLEVGDASVSHYKDSSSSPYRYLFNEMPDISTVEQRVKAMVEANSIFFKPDTDITVEMDNGYISKQLTIHITKEYNLSNFAKRVGLSPVGKIEYEVTADCNNPAEFIRNIDLADDIVRDLTGSDVKGFVDGLFMKVKDLVKMFK